MKRPPFDSEFWQKAKDGRWEQDQTAAEIAAWEMETEPDIIYSLRGDFARTADGRRWGWSDNRWAWIEIA